MPPPPDPPGAWLGLDLGTSSLKAVLADEAGRTLGEGREPLALEAPEPLAAEQDPEAWWGAAVRAIRACVAAAGGVRVTGVGLTGQKHALLPLDGGLRPLGPAVLWADGRAASESREAARRVPALARRTGAPALPGYLVPKWLRFRARHPAEAERVAHLCFAKDWLRLRLTGELATDPTEAGASQLFDVGRRRWSPALCSAFDVPLAALPSVHACVETTGRVHEAAARETGLDAGVPVVAGAGDNEAAALACGAVAPGTAAVVLGTSGTLVAPATARGGGRGLVWGRGTLRRGVVATGVVLAAGRALAWIRDAAFGPDASFACVVEEAEAVLGDEDLPLFLPSLAGERSPVPDPEATGAFAGLRPHHGRAHLAAAVLEGVAASFGLVVAALRKAGVVVDAVRLTSGGAASAVWTRLVAAAADAPASTVGGEGGPARGAALLAAAGGASDARLAERAALWAAPSEPYEARREDVGRLARTAVRLERLRDALRRTRERPRAPQTP